MSVSKEKDHSQSGEQGMKDRIYCPTCGKEVQGDSVFCTHCGARVTEYPENVEQPVPAAQSSQGAAQGKEPLYITITVLSAVLVFVLFKFVLFHGNGQKEADYVHSTENERIEGTVEEESSQENSVQTFEEKAEGVENVDPDAERNEPPVNPAENEDDNSGEAEVKLYSMDTVLTFYASSSLSEYGMTHSPDLAMDGDRTTGWVEGAAGQGEGEYLTIEFDDVYEIHGFTIYAGYQKSEDLYRKNSRPSAIQVVYDGGNSERYELADKNGGQEIELPAPVQTSSVTFVIDSVYSGSKYEDTVISEIVIY